MAESNSLRPLLLAQEMSAPIGCRGGQLAASRPFNLSSPSEFTAKDMDTDQWAEAVAAMGGKYQVRG